MAVPERNTPALQFATWLRPRSACSPGAAKIVSGGTSFATICTWLFQREHLIANPGRMRKPVVLLGYQFSVYSRIARVALHEKGVPFEE